MQNFEEYLINKKKKKFNRVDFYVNYYKNLSPSDFKIIKKNNIILIKIKKSENGEIK